MQRAEVNAIDWMGTARQIQRIAAYSLLTLAVTVSLAVLGIKLRSSWLLHLSMWMAAPVAIMELVAAKAETSLVFRTQRFLLQHRKKLCRSDERLLQRTLREAKQTVMTAWSLVPIAAGVPIVIDMTTLVPVGGQLLGMVLIMFGMQYINIRFYRKLATILDQSQNTPASYTLSA